MASAHELARGRKRLRALIEFALREGWKVVRTAGHLLFTKPGLRICTRSTASDHRAERNAVRSFAPRRQQNRQDSIADEPIPGERPWLMAPQTWTPVAGLRLRAHQSPGCGPRPIPSPTRRRGRDAGPVAPV